MISLLELVVLLTRVGGRGANGALIMALIRAFWLLARPWNVGGRGRVRDGIGFKSIREG